MSIVWSDEAWGSEKDLQAIASVILDNDESEILVEKLTNFASETFETELKFARVRNNVAYTETVKNFLEVFVAYFSKTEWKIFLISWSDTKPILDQMYEEIFLLAQWWVEDEIIFCPDKNNMLKRYASAEVYKQYWVTEIREQNSEEAIIVQVMDIISWIIIFLREHYGTYRARKEWGDRFQKLADFERALHMRCEVVHHFFELLEKHIGKVEVLETWLFAVDGERVVVLEW